MTAFISENVNISRIPWERSKTLLYIRIKCDNIQNRIEYSGYCKFGWEDMQIYGEEFREIVLSDPFYTETLYSYFPEDEQMASWEFNFEGSGLGKKNEE